MRNILIAILFLSALLVFFPDAAQAQCAMCKATAESAQNGVDQDITANGINKGILYIIAIPYILIIGFGLFFFRKKLKPFFINLGILRN